MKRLWRMTSRRVVGIALTGGVLLSAVIASPAQAVGSPDASSLASTCSSDAWAAGDCITSIWKEGEDPIVEGVRQALSRGEDLQVRAFLETRSKHRTDITQMESESLLQDQSSAKGSPSLAEPMSGGSDGYFYGPFHEIDELFYYGTCSTGTGHCSTGGLMYFHMNFSVADYPRTVVDGFIALDPGSTFIKMSDFRCETWYNNSPLWDLKVHDWSNCESAWNSWTYVDAVNILPQTWNQGGTIGKLYHNYYNLTFTIQGTSNPLGRDFRTQEYKVLPGGGASFSF